jgi:hypothetical protein
MPVLATGKMRRVGLARAGALSAFRRCALFRSDTPALALR